MRILLVLGFGLLCGLLGMYSGSRNTSLGWRRYGIPTVILLNALLATGSWRTVTVLTLCGVYSIGYGVPDATDSGSTLGRFWYKITNGNHDATDFLTRGTVGLAYAVSLLSLPILKGSWLQWGILALLTMATYIVFTVWIKGEPVIHWKDKEFLVEDLLVYSITNSLGLMLIWMV